MIRRFTFADLKRVLDIEHHAFPKSPYDSATFINLFALYPDTFLVYVQKNRGWEMGRILGYIVFSRDGHIISIAVDPQSRRRGIGTALLERAMAFPRVKRIRAEVRVGNRGAQAFYEKTGFRITGVVPNYYGDEDALIVEKVLKQLNQDGKSTRKE